MNPVIRSGHGGPLYTSRDRVRREWDQWPVATKRTIRKMPYLDRQNQLDPHNIIGGWIRTAVDMDGGLHSADPDDYPGDEDQPILDDQGRPMALAYFEYDRLDPWLDYDAEAYR